MALLRISLLFLAVCSGTQQPGRFHCETQTCALKDAWVSANFDNSSQLCKDAQEIIISSLVQEAPTKCRGKWPWYDCRRQYCDAFQRALETVAHLGGPRFHGGDDCRPLLAFNQTLCETHYRDSEAFCDCLCPALPLLSLPPLALNFKCEEELLKFLLLGRRGGNFLQNHSIRNYCKPFLCEWFEKIGDPDPAYPVEGAPKACLNYHLPFRVQQCEQILKKEPYDPCPWDLPTSEDNLLRCADLTNHSIDNRHADSWSACIDHGGKWQCPKNFPVMCAGRHCVGSSEHCCQTEVAECREQKARQCSPVLKLALPEWQGFLTPEEAAKRASLTTTTGDPDQLPEFPAASERSEEGFMVAVEPYLPYILGALGGAGAFCAVAISLYLCLKHSESFQKVVPGVARLLKVYHSDPVSVFKPSDPFPKGWEKELPARGRPWQEVESERLDAAANNELRSALKAAEELGHCDVGADHNPRAFAEAAKLRRAMREVRLRGLEGDDWNAELLVRGERWLKTLDGEYALFKGMEAARPALQIVGQRMTVPPLPGVPWHSTKAGQAAEGEVQRAAWHQVEGLRVLLREAKDVGASDVLLERASLLLAQLVAKTPELPADRCVLDPEGQGLKLLPMGKQRAIWLTTGESYMYTPQAETAGNLGDCVLPLEELGDVATDEARPVCAEWAKRHSCKAGRRCPWRHVAPQPGDSIREAIMYEDC